MLQGESFSACLSLIAGCVWVPLLPGRVYPAELCCAPGDMSRVDWVEKGLLVEGQEDMVEAVLDEVGEQGGRHTWCWSSGR